ncbi:MAG: hypothetical protein ACE5GC_01485 [Acidimicrobiia bacterium]
MWIAWVVGLRAVGDNSFLWHVRAGTAQLDLGRVFTTDPFSFTSPGDAWRTQSWLAELGYGFLENLTGGIGWVHLLLFAVVSLTLVAVGMAVYGTTHRIAPTAVAMLVVAWQGAPFAVPRPVIFSYLALAIVVLVLQRSDADLWVLPPLIWAWAAVHGSFVLGIGVIVLDAVRGRSKQRAGTALAAVVLATMTAHGVGVWRILVDFLGARGALDLITEWQSPDFSSPFVVPYAIGLAGLLVASASGKISRRDLVLLGPFAFFGMLANRNLYPALIVLAPHASLALVTEREPRRRDDSQIVNWAFVTVMVGFALLGLARDVELDENRFPDAAALEAVEDGAPLFHGTAVGGYLIYAEWPERLVFIDDRAELFGEEGFRTFHDVRLACGRPADCVGGEGYREVFERLSIRQALLEPEWPIVGALTDDGWVERYRDAHFVVMAATG